MVGRLSGFSLNRDGTQNLTITTAEDFSTAYDELKDLPVEIQIKKAQKHRSMEANRYCWVLVDQIAEKMHLKRSEVYRNAIREIGGVSTDALMDINAVPIFKQIWEKQGIGNQIEIVDLDGGQASIRVFYGSSHYDTRQMSALLDNLIQDAESLGIPTITPKEEEKMLGRWARKKEQTNEQEHPAG